MSEDTNMVQPDTAQPDLVQPETKKRTRPEEWNLHFGEVQVFTQSNLRWPSTTSDDNVEKSLAQWWSRQKYYFKKYERGEKSPGINESRANIIRNLIASHGSYERDGVWDTRYYLVQMQIKNHNKLWPYNTKDTLAEQVMRWWNQQKTFYRKFRKGERLGGMTEERAQKVEDILRLLQQPIIPKNPNLGV